MTKEDVIQDFTRSESDLSLTDEDPQTLYFLYGKCPIWKYTFKDNQLVAVGYLVMELGVWSYIDADFPGPTHDETH
ncbi:hypothetical protein [Desulfoluna sp.]|uniref:hypothetical protein n=1 Tax=Desulfoluna sp. TaxID=2045199 RepID=UPI0026396AB7|nr:hypothetical protein [Desulfoluna sp.]